MSECSRGESECVSVVNGRVQIMCICICMNIYVYSGYIVHLSASSSIFTSSLTTVLVTSLETSALGSTDSHGDRELIGAALAVFGGTVVAVAAAVAVAVAVVVAVVATVGVAVVVIAAARPTVLPLSEPPKDATSLLLALLPELASLFVPLFRMSGGVPDSGSPGVIWSQYRVSTKLVLSQY